MTPSSEVNVLVLGGPEGPSVYLDNHRVAGPKPWGGGTILHEFTAKRSEVLKALGFALYDLEDK